MAMCRWRKAKQLMTTSWKTDSWNLNGGWVDSEEMVADWKAVSGM